MWAVLNAANYVAFATLLYFFGGMMGLVKLIMAIVFSVGFNAFLLLGAICSSRCMVIFWMVLNMLGIIGHFIGGVGLLLVSCTK